MTGDKYLDEYQIEKLTELMPVIVIMTIVCVLGIAGNSFTIAFYGFVARKTSTVFFITTLAIVDLIVCILIIPQIAEMAVNVKFTSAAACKLIHFFGHWAILISGHILWFISIDRYRHVCCPSKTQVSIKGAKWAVFIFIVISLILTVRVVVHFDIITFPIESQPDNCSVTIAHYCTTREDPQYRVSVTLFNSIEALLVLTTLVTFCITYGKIVWTIKKGAIAFGTDRKHRDYEENIENSEVTRNVESTTSDPSANEGSSTEVVNSNYGRINENSGSNRKSNSSKIKRPEISITLMMLVVSLVFFICYVPYLIVKISIRSYNNASQLELGVGIQLIIRFLYVNSFSNPIVFCFFNPQFRRFIKNKLLSVNPWRGQLSIPTMSPDVPM